MTKEEFINNGYNVIDCNDNDESGKLAEFLKNNYPSIYRDGEINLEELKNELNIPVNHKTNGYGLNFIGRNLAVARYRNITDKELKINYKLSKDFNNTKNIVIKGDNIDALKILNKYYRGKIKCIYIDPPYNTDSDNFLYPDRFNREELEILGLQEISEEDYSRMEFIFKESKKSHNAWLTFMYPRLKLAKDLLTDDGVIFISIDDNEYANLKLICDEIFGEDNTDTMIWRKSGVSRDGKMKNTTTFRKDHEYIIVCFKKQIHLKKSFEKPEWENKYSNLDNDPRGDYKAGSISNKEEASNPMHNNYYTVVSPSGKCFTRQFNIPKEEFDRLDKDNRIFWGKNKDAVPQIKIFENEKRKVTTSSTIIEKDDIINTFVNNKEYTTTKGSKELDKILHYEGIGSAFKSKPTKLLYKLIQISSSENDIILDFFAGSGTTGQAVMELNAEDGGNRKFILCQIHEIIDRINKNNKPAFNFCKEHELEPEIFSITVERLNRAGKKIKEESKKDIDIGYKVFDLQDNNKINLDENKKAHLIFNDVVDLSRIYNMIISVGLDEPISKLEIIIENCAYCISSENKKRYYITNSSILLEDKNKIKFSKMIENGDVYIDGWTVNSNVSLQQYKDNVKIIL